MISVIIPTYNEEDVILDCLESLGNQTAKDFEIIIVDDGSTDKTWGILSRLQKINLKFKIFQQKHEGPAVARNLGAKHAKGQILVFVDSDMTFHSSFLKKLVEPITQGKARGTFSIEEYVSNWENSWARCWNTNEGWERKRRHPRVYPKTQKVFRAILKSEFDKVKGFDKGGYTDDWSLSEKLDYEAVLAVGAIFYHKNPSSLGEVFHHAKWASKRKYKLGIIGVLVALVRVSLPMSLIIGIIKSITNNEIYFLPFKIVYDLGATFGILEYTFKKKGSK